MCELLVDWNNTPNDKRLYLWKALRADIGDSLLTDQINSIVKFFAKVPYGARTLDYYTPTSWPTPWEILYNGTFCKSSISLLMFYTFVLLNTSNKIELHMIDDSDDIYLVPIINNKYVLNYELGSVSEYKCLSKQFIDKQIFTELHIKKIT